MGKKPRIVWSGLNTVKNVNIDWDAEYDCVVCGEKIKCREALVEQNNNVFHEKCWQAAKSEGVE